MTTIDRDETRRRAQEEFEPPRLDAIRRALDGEA